ncbi:RNA polymerase sigma factor [Cohnella panacarvi]|uniref:RNA polymerase sigma factor n=1 Tax=Cohnella panacarvi TaxID=400776 RepID=UPI0004791E3D|nr:RNA polymerase sigma factor [Cohnella panacarvi]
MTSTVQDRAELEKLGGALTRYCLSLTESRWEAEELSQEAWLKVLDSSVGLTHANPEAYLLRVARNAWIDRARKQARRLRTMQAIRSVTEPYALPDESLIGIESAMLAIMNGLSPLQRAVFFLRDVYGYSADETAVRLGLTVGAVKAALHRARAALPAVRKAIRSGELQEEGLRDVLKALAHAYGGGDIETLLALVQHNDADPAPAIGALQSRRVRASAIPARHGGSVNSMGMAA